MRNSLKLVLGSAIAIPAMMGLGLPAGASTATASASSIATSGADAASAAASGLPKSDITASNAFKPSTLSGAGHKGTKCTKKLAGAEVINENKATEQITYLGAAFGNPIPSEGAEYICYLSATGTPPPATAVFGLSSKAKAKLKIHFS